MEQFFLLLKTFFLVIVKYLKIFHKIVSSVISYIYSSVTLRLSILSYFNTLLLWVSFTFIQKYIYIL